MPICLWLNYSKLFKSITRMIQMSLFTHLDSFLPISPQPQLQSRTTCSGCMVNLQLHAEHPHTSFTASPCDQLLGDPQVLPRVLSPKLQGDSVNSPSCSPYCACLHGDPIYNNGIYQIFTYCAKYFVFMLSSYSEYYITLHFTEGTNCEKVSHLHSKVYIVNWKIQGLNLGQSD